MNQQSILKRFALRPMQLKLAAVLAGLIGLGLYRLLYATGIDGRGLLKNWHPAWVALCVLSILTAGLLWCSTAPLKGRARFPRSLPACVGCAAAAACAVLTCLSDLRSGAILYAVPGLLAALCFAALALCRIQGARPNFLLHVIVCIHFALQMLNLYQRSSIDPQIQDYIFQLFACIALTITAYQLAAHDLGRGQRRWLWMASLSAVFLCMVSMGSTGTGFHLTGALWAITATTAPRRPRARYMAENN